MTPAEVLAALKATVAKMTPKPWRTDSLDYICGETEVVGDVEARDRDGIVSLRNNADALIEIAEAAQALMPDMEMGRSCNLDGATVYGPVFAGKDVVRLRAAIAALEAAE